MILVSALSQRKREQRERERELDNLIREGLRRLKKNIDLSKFGSEVGSSDGC